jgi:hypothetical protein
MVASHNTEVIDQDRHRLLSSAATGIADADIVSLFPPGPAGAKENSAIRPIRVNVPVVALVDLRRRITARRFLIWRRSIMDPKGCGSPRFAS